MKITPPTTMTYTFNPQEVYDALILYMRSQNEVFPFEYTESTLKRVGSDNGMSITFEGLRPRGQ